ncbi:DNA-binding transcriptional repressor FabR [Tsuneonella dongtanensis]|uniref:DNA-binding transcriptional repressor FabR n=2 Tax=Tsuneonella dongtanensis TaxID=692370 RepID=A0A1B2AF01_9SPHN|nr:DNA-binding transcriptional repressor FabR [Tsuneonella dongtanensis]
MAALEGNEGVDVSLRELARIVGVSPAAVYRHFPNKDALLAELGGEGLRILGTAQRKAYEAAGGGAAGFAETGRAYVRFALAHPALFRLIFTHGEPGRWRERESDPAREILEEATQSLAGKGAAAERLATQAWAIAHGISMLMLDNRLPADDALIDRLLDTRSLFPVQGSKSEESP